MNDPAELRKCCRNILTTSFPRSYHRLEIFRLQCISQFTDLGLDTSAHAALNHSSDEVARKAAVHLLSRGNDAGRRLLIHQLKIMSWHIKVEGLQALHQYGSSRDLLYILPLMKHHHRLVRCQAVWTTGHLGNFQMIPLLEPMIDDPDDMVSEYVFTALGSLRDASGVEVLERHLDHRILDYQVFAASALYVRGIKTGRDILIRALQRRKRYLQYIAARTFAQCGEMIAKDYLREMITEPEFPWRDLAIISFQMIHNPSDVDWYKKTYDTLGTKGKIQIVNALGSFRRSDDISWMLDRIHEASFNVRERLFASLADYENVPLPDQILQHERQPANQKLVSFYVLLGKHLPVNLTADMFYRADRSRSLYRKVGLSMALLLSK